MNLVDTILKSLSGEAIAKLASTFGAGEDETKRAAGAAVPALLSGIGSLAKTTEGAKKLWSAVQGIDDTVPDDFARLVGGEQQDVMTKMGSGLLEGLFGKSTLNTLINVLGSFLGGKSALVSKLLPTLASLVMGTLSKQVKSGGLDLSGLTSLLAGQRENIADAMPAGLSNALSNAQGLGDFSDIARDTRETVSATGRAAATTARDAANETASAAKWLVPLALLAAVLGGLYWMNTRTAPDAIGATDRAATPDIVVQRDIPGPTDEIVANKPVDPAVSIKTDLSDYLSNFGTTLSGITDVETARAAVPRLEEMSTQFETASTAFRQLPEASRPVIAEAVDASVTKLDEERQRINEIPGVGDILGAILNRIFETLSAFAKQ